MKKVEVRIKATIDVVTRYIDALNAYDALKSDANFKHLEEVKKAYKDFLVSNK
jgi:hypothetical protein